MRTGTTPSTRVTAIGTITGMVTTTTTTTAHIPTIIITITKAGSEATRSPNKKQRLRPLFFYSPSHSLTERLRASNLALATLGL